MSARPDILRALLARQAGPVAVPYGVRRLAMRTTFSGGDLYDVVLRARFTASNTGRTFPVHWFRALERAAEQASGIAGGIPTVEALFLDELGLLATAPKTEEVDRG